MGKASAKLSKREQEMNWDFAGVCLPGPGPVNMQKAGVPLQGHCAHSGQVQRKLLDCNGESSVGPWCW